MDTSSFLVGLFSGSNFPVTALPRWLLGTKTLMPLVAESLLVVVFMVLMQWVGTWVFKLLERRVRMKGTLGQH